MGARGLVRNLKVRENNVELCRRGIGNFPYYDVLRNAQKLEKYVVEHVGISVFRPMRTLKCISILIIYMYRKTTNCVLSKGLSTSYIHIVIRTCMSRRKCDFQSPLPCLLVTNNRGGGGEK